MKVFVCGSTAYDLLLGYDGAFADGLDPTATENLSMAFVTPHFAKHHGGTAANIAWGMQLLGGNPIMISTVGKDGGEYVSLLAEKGVNVSYVEQLDDHMTATALIGSDTRENQIIFFHPGADAHGSLPNLADEVDGDCYAIVSPRDQSLMMQMLQWCDTYKVPCLFDPGQQLMAFGDDDLRRALSLATAFIGNEHEWNLLTERLQVSAHDLLSDLEYIIVTRGENGVDIIDREGEVHVNGCAADQVINPTGAGDAFRAGFLYGLSQGWGRNESAKWGCGMGSLVVEIEGTLLEGVDLDCISSRINA